jgi:hypothetical protein
MGTRAAAAALVVLDAGGEDWYAIDSGQLAFKVIIRC